MKKFGIIGYGRFGKLWSTCLTPYGEVFVYDEKLTIEKQSREFSFGVRMTTLANVVAVDMLFLAVPVSEFVQCCHRIAPLLPPTTVVIDVCGVKVYPATMMQEMLPYHQSLIATHPLFGPDSVALLGLAGRRIALCPLRADKKEISEIKKLFSALKLEILETTPDEHDRQMARSQALVHLLGRAFADLHLSDQIISTPDYQSLRKIDTLVNNDTWQLFFDMQRYNPYTADMRKTLRQSLARLEEKIVGDATIENDLLDTLRQGINDVDEEMITLISRRLALGKKIQTYKKEHGLPVVDATREEHLAKEHRRLAKEQGIENELLVKKIFALLINAIKKI